MAAVFPLDTTKPWTFNGVTYEYDATEDRWFVISTNKTDFVDDNLETLNRDVDVINTTIDQEIENRTSLLNAAAAKNNQQDAAILELDQRLDAISDASGTLLFKGRYQYVLEKSEEACNEVYLACLIEAAGDPVAAGQCSTVHATCTAGIDDPYPAGSFTTKGATNVIADIEEFVIQGVDLDGQLIDWIGIAEVDDYLEFLDTGDGDTALYQVIEEPKIANTERSMRVKFIRETGLGDSKFNLQSVYTIRVFKAKQGIDIIEADDRYVARPYTVLFSDTPPVEGDSVNGVLRNGELWYDTQNLELFVWNNNAWVTAAKPPSQDVVIAEVISDVDRLMEESAGHASAINSLVSDLATENNIYYSDDAPTGDFTGTLRNGDIWIDSDDLTIKFYSGGVWVNPDRQVGGDYLEKSGGFMTGDIDMTGGPEPGANIYMHNNAFIRFGWGSTPATLYGGYVFMRDENIFEIGAYNDNILRFKGSSEFISSPQVPEPTDDTHASTKKYVDDRIAELEARITALGG